MVAKLTKGVVFVSLFVLVALTTLILESQKALAQNFIPVDYPGTTTGTSVNGINSNGVMVGSSGNHGFVLQNGLFTAIDFPNAQSTSVSGINNNGDIVGSYFDGAMTHGFLFTGRTYTTIDPPNSLATYAAGIDDAGQIVGYYETEGPEGLTDFGFLYSAGSYSDIVVPGSSLTMAEKINGAGDVVGYFSFPSSNYYGFLLQNGAFTTIQYPASIDTLAFGINDGGQIVGEYDSFIYPGFEYNPAVPNNPYSTISVPGAAATFASDINDAGQIGGGYSDALGHHGFVSAVGPFAYVANMNSGSVSMIDIPTSLPAATIPVGSGPWGVAISPDGSQVYVSNYSGNSVSVIDTTATPPSVVATVPNVSTPMGVAFTPPDVKQAYVVNGGSNSVSVFDTTTTPPTLAATVQGQGLSSPIGVAMASTTSGDFAYVSNSGLNTVSVIAVGNNPTVVQNVIVGTGPRWVAVTPDSSQVYVENAGSQNISVISVGDNNQVIATIPINGSPNGAAFTPDSKFAYVADSDADTVSVIYTASNPPLVVATLTGFTQPTQVAMSTDGSLAYVTNANNTLSVVDTASNTIVATVPTGSAPAGIAIASNPQAPLTLTQPLSPTQSNNFNFGTNNYRTTYPPGTQFSGMYMTVTAVPITQAQFHQRVAGIQQFAGATCIVSAGAGGDCVDHVVTCSNDPSGNPIVDCPLPAGGTIDVETDFATGQSIVNPGYLTATVGQSNWQNIFSGIFQEGPRTKVSGKTPGFSEFVAVSLGAQSPQGQARFELLSPQFPKTFPAGLDVPIEIGLKSVVDGSPITGASVNISLVMTADANGNPTQNVVSSKNATFKQSQPGVYQYSIKAAQYALGTYSLTIYGDMFPAYSSRFLVASPTTISLSSSPNPSTYGQAVTFTAVVVPPPPDGEIVSFIKAGAVLGTGTLSGGSASLTISTLKAGTRTVKAVYGGDSKFAASRSKALDQMVNPN